MIIFLFGFLRCTIDKSLLDKPVRITSIKDPGLYLALNGDRVGFSRDPRSEKTLAMIKKVGKKKYKLEFGGMSVCHKEKKFFSLGKGWPGKCNESKKKHKNEAVTWNIKKKGAGYSIKSNRSLNRRDCMTLESDGVEMRGCSGWRKRKESQIFSIRAVDPTDPPYNPDGKKTTPEKKKPEKVVPEKEAEESSECSEEDAAFKSSSTESDLLASLSGKCEGGTGGGSAQNPYVQGYGGQQSPVVYGYFAPCVCAPVSQAQSVQGSSVYGYASGSIPGTCTCQTSQ